MLYNHITSLSKYLSFDWIKFFRFLILGSVTFVIYYTILWLLFSYEGLQYRGAVAIAYSAAIIFHFLANRKITFNAGRMRFRNQILRYLTVALLNYFIQILIIHVLYVINHINFYISTVIGIIFTTIFGYYIMNTWVFKEDIK